MLFYCNARSRPRSRPASVGYNGFRPFYQCQAKVFKGLADKRYYRFPLFDISNVELQIKRICNPNSYCQTEYF